MSGTGGESRPMDAAPDNTRPDRLMGRKRRIEGTAEQGLRRGMGPYRGMARATARARAKTLDGPNARRTHRLEVPIRAA